MEQHTSYTDITHDDSHGGGTKEIWKVTGILTLFTIIEVGIGFWMMGMQDGGLEKSFMKAIVIIFMLLKAFYIVGYFMHLKHELRNLIMTIIVPCGLFVWFIIAFLSDGNSFKNLRNQYNPVYKERTTVDQAPKEEAKPEEKKAEQQ